MIIILYSTGDSSARNGFENSSDISEDSGVILGSSDQHGFEVSRTGGNRKRSSEPAEAGNLSPGSDVRDSGILTWTLFPRNSNKFLSSLFLLIVF